VRPGPGRGQVTGLAGRAGQPTRMGRAWF
jgi:hypothetical protein